MILRTAESFLAGRSGHQGSAAWNGITANLEELVTFFNLLVYHRQIPMVDYGYTFNPSEGFKVSRLYDVCNDIRAGTTIAVSVGGPAYEAARGEAISPLELHGPINPSLGASIAEEMTAFDYQWRPYLGDFFETLLGGDETPDRRATTFVYGGILFWVYAKRLGAAHLLPSKRASLSAAAAIEAPTARFDDENAVFDQLDHVVDQLPEFQNEHLNIPAILPVLPYLLSRYQPRSAYELVMRALEVREEASVSALSETCRQLVTGWREDAVIPDAIVRDLRRVGMMLHDHMTPYAPPDAMPGLTAYFLKAVPVRPLWNWALSNVPGKNHIKLLYRLHMAARQRARGRGSLCVSRAQLIEIVGVIVSQRSSVPPNVAFREVVTIWLTLKRRFATHFHVGGSLWVFGRRSLINPGSAPGPCFFSRTGQSCARIAVRRTGTN